LQADSNSREVNSGLLNHGATMNETEYLDARSARLEQHAADIAEDQAAEDRREIAAMLEELNTDLEREAEPARIAG
jgi:hypothetical protein